MNIKNLQHFSKQFCTMINAGSLRHVHARACVLNMRESEYMQCRPLRGRGSLVNFSLKYS